MCNYDKQTKVQNYIQTGHKGLEYQHCKIAATREMLKQP